jgi:hypothetical protein
MSKTNKSESVGDISDLDFFRGCEMPSPTFWRKQALARKYRNLANLKKRRDLFLSQMCTGRGRFSELEGVTYVRA